MTAQKPAFTPSPWRVRKKPSTNIMGERIAIIVADANNKPVAEVLADVHGVRDAPERARLIAAAPAMYAALSDLVAGVEKEVNENGGSGYLLARLTDARAALAQAEGQP